MTIEDKKNKVTLINEFLGVLGILNTYTDNAMNFYVEVLKKEGRSIEQVIEAHLFDPYNQYVVTTQKVNEDWKVLLKKKIRPYFIGIFLNFEKPLSANYYFKQLIDNLESLIDEFMENINSLQVDNNMIEVSVNTTGWYEAAYDDFAFDIGEHLLFIHFGFSD